MKFVASTISNVLMALSLYLLLTSGGGGSWGNAPSFAADKLTVLITEDDTPTGRLALVGEQDDIMRSLLPDGVRKSVESAGGEFQVLGKSNSVSLNTPNIQAAFSVADKSSLPSIVASNPKNGIKPQKLPATVAETKSLLAPLGVK